MAWFKDKSYFTHLDSDEFDKTYSPGQDAPFAGIYRCMGCNREIGIAQASTMPPQTHHTHTSKQGPIRWRPIAIARHDPS